MLVPVSSDFNSYPNEQLPCSLRTDVDLEISLSCSCERFVHSDCV